MNTMLLVFPELANQWDAFFFAEIPTLTLCVFRLLTGILVLLDTWSWRSVYRDLLSPEGWYAFEYFDQREQPLRFSLLRYLPRQVRSVEWLLGIQFLAALLLALGVWANLAALVCFVTLVSLHNRNIHVLNSGDTVCRFFCLFLVFAPSDGQLSLLYPTQILDANATGWPWTLYMVRLFVANIYLKNVWFKLLGPAWRKGTATQNVLQTRIWNRVALPDFLQRSWFYRASNYGTLAVEAALCTLIWVEAFRWPVLLAGVLFHIGLWYFLRIRLFQVAMMVGLATFIRPEEYATFFEWLGIR